ncbi:MAG: flagellar hook-associated protein FlgL [Stagnimonas sp.]|nr:flagellar hook-associated protein FlgL [Stagnimonas sp.]
MRVSTPALFNSSLSRILNQQAEVAKAQEQVSSGVKFKTAGQDPSGMAQVMALQQAQAEHMQLGNNVTTLRQRLSGEENALASAGDVLPRVRELAVQANTATVSPENRKQIAAELTQLKTQLIDIANTSDGVGHYVFGGTNDGSKPFADATTGISYSGTQTVREIAVGEGRSMSEGDSGDATFLRVANSTGGNTDLFTRVQNVIDATLADTSTSAARTANQAQFASALADIDGGIEHLSTVRASVGSRLATLDDVDSRLEGLDTQLQTTLSDVRDLDYAESISRLQLHSLSLQAAQSAFAKVQGLSLFNYLR